MQCVENGRLTMLLTLCIGSNCFVFNMDHVTSASVDRLTYTQIPSSVGPNCCAISEDITTHTYSHLHLLLGFVIIFAYTGKFRFNMMYMLLSSSRTSVIKQYQMVDHSRLRKYCHHTCMLFRSHTSNYYQELLNPHQSIVER